MHHRRGPSTARESAEVAARATENRARHPHSRTRPAEAQGLPGLRRSVENVRKTDSRPTPAPPTAEMFCGRLRKTFFLQGEILGTPFLARLWRERGVLILPQHRYRWFSPALYMYLMAGL